MMSGQPTGNSGEDEMKIIRVDNFDRDNQPDKLIAENVDIFYASTMIKGLNDRYSGTGSPVFFKLVEDSYKLAEVGLP
jgi:hypothetical protein